MDQRQKKKMGGGPIAWMARNRVTPNLLMLILLVGGFLFALSIKQEVFPEFDLDMVQVRVPYPGSSPEEVEQGIVLAVEEAIRGLEGVEEVTATASESAGVVTAELLESADKQKVYQDIQQEIDRITTFPEDAEEPEVSLLTIKREVLQIQLYGDSSEWVMRQLAEQVRDRLLQDASITQVDLIGARNYELAVMIDQDTLRAYDLTLEEVSRRIGSNSLELPGGDIETSGGEILLRVKQRKDWAREFAKIPIITTANGSVVLLGDIATVRDGFADVERWATFNGRRAVGLGVYRVGSQTPIEVSEASRRAMEEIERELPAGVNWDICRDRADTYRQRLELLLKNAFLGLMLVLLVLGLFLEFRLAFWVTMGIPISFLGAFLFLPTIDVTVNMISMFAFIVALGIVVDDAIVVGENIYEYRNQGMSNIKAAILGARDVTLPVTFSIITNIVAFSPLFFVPGAMGKIWRVIPTVVVTVFAISWVEALFILPAHLGHVRQRRSNRLAGWLHSRQQGFSRLFEKFIKKCFNPFLHLATRFRRITISAGLAILMVIVGYVASGRIGIILMPRVESRVSAVTATLPFGSPLWKVEQVRNKLVEEAQAVIRENGGEKLATGVFANIDESRVEVIIYMTGPDVRPVSTGEVTRLWRERVGQIAGLQSLLFESDRGGPGRGAALTVELSHRRIDVLDRASEKLAEMLKDFSNVKDIDDGYTPGKEQLNFRIKPEGESLGLTAAGIARQIRNSFYGAEALRQQRGRNEVRVRVKFPQEQRCSQYDIENMLVRTPSGREVPLMQVVEMERGRSYTSISRRNGRRTVTVTANVEPISQTSQVMATLNSEILPQIERDFPGLSYGWEGRQASMRESMSSIFSGFIIAVLAIYAMLAVPFGSYIQPLIVMVAIPFGIVGAVLGHMLMGYSLSVMSMMGIVALSGVVVNDSLILIDYANQLRKKEGASAFDAIHQAGVRRFRPVILTTFTTFGGLTPIILETSRQARFMIPMAISLGFGILFATVITLLLVPCLYLLLEDTVALMKKMHWIIKQSEVEEAF